MSSIKNRILASASANAGLQALLQVGPIFQFGDTQLPQNWDITGHSAVVMFQVSNPKDYIMTGPMLTSWTRIQFTIYGHGNDSTNADAVAQALFLWLLTFAPTTVPNQAASYVANDRDAGIAQTQPLTYMRIIDVMFYFDESS